jgi:DNA polymerase-1
MVSLINEGAPDPGGKGPQKVRRLAAVFDSRGPTFRHKRYAEYKATRQKAPEDLHAQVPLVEETLRALKAPILQAEGYEADDIIATLARICRAEGRDCYILSADKDLLQLVGEGTWELRPPRGARPEGGSSGGFPYEVVGPAEVKAEWGVTPDRVLDLLSLMGDSSDNVPGVKGVGEKTAARLMARYGSLDEIYKNIAGIEGAMGKKLAEGRESAYFSKSLIALEYQVPLPIKDIDELSLENLDRTAGARILLREGIRQSALALDPQVESAAASTTASTGDASSAAASTGAVGPDRGPADPALLGEGCYRAVLDFGELEGIFAQARKQKLLALDFETDSLDAWNAHPSAFPWPSSPGRRSMCPWRPTGAKAPGRPSKGKTQPGRRPPSWTRSRCGRPWRPFWRSPA